MQYLLLIYQRRTQAPAAARRAPPPPRASRVRALQRSPTAQRHAPRRRRAAADHTATSVRVRSGEVLLTDGPFAETKEQLAGYYVIECDTLDEAIEVAAAIPGAHTARSRSGPRSRESDHPRR